MVFPPVPEMLLKLVLGEMSTLALMSQRVSNGKIISAGFRFKHVNIHAALKDLLK
jgi:NAD dependent epimerase/dehydratase family enzyme